MSENSADPFLPRCDPGARPADARGAGLQARSADSTGLRAGRERPWTCGAGSPAALEVSCSSHELFLPGTKTKTKRPRRIPISAALHAVLVRRLTRPAGESYEPQDYVFGTAAGTRVKDIKTAWRASCRRAGIQNLRFHVRRRDSGAAVSRLSFAES